jgi:lipopolysaccharide transport system ATP-binding protein
MGKMGEVAKGGRTVLFVSHNMAAVENLCEKGIVLDKGRMTYAGKAIDSINRYLNSLIVKNEQNIAAREDRKGTGKVHVTKVEIENDRGEKNIPFPIGSNLRFRISYSANESLRNPRVIIGIYDSMNVGMTRFDTDMAGSLPSFLADSGQITCTTEAINLSPGRYFINIAFFRNGIMEDYLAHVSFLDIVDSDYFGSGKMFSESDVRLTKVLIRHTWGAIS